MLDSRQCAGHSPLMTGDRTAASMDRTRVEIATASCATTTPARRLRIAPHTMSRWQRECRARLDDPRQVVAERRAPGALPQVSVDVAPDAIGQIAVQELGE